MPDDSQLLDALRRFAHDMSVDYDLTDVLFRLTDDVTRVLGVAGAGIAIADEDDKLRYATASSDDIASLEAMQEAYQAGPCVESFRMQSVVVVTDIAARVDWPEYRSEAERLGFRSVAGLPLRIGSERLGGAEPLRQPGPHVGRRGAGGGARPGRHGVGLHGPPAPGAQPPADRAAPVRPRLPSDHRAGEGHPRRGAPSEHRRVLRAPAKARRGATTPRCARSPRPSWPTASAPTPSRSRAPGRRPARRPGDRTSPCGRSPRCWCGRTARA